MTPRRVLIVARFAVSALLLVYLLSRIELARLAGALASAQVSWLALALLAIAAGKVIISLRWQLLLARQGVSAALPDLVSSVLIGDFWSALLPTKLGGEVSRAYDVSRHFGGSAAAGVSSVTVDRVIGVLSLTTVAALTLIVGPHNLPQLERWGWLIAAVLLLSLAILVVLLRAECSRKLEAFLRQAGAARFADWFAGLVSAFQLMANDRLALAKAFLLSVLLQVVIVVHYACIAAALALPVSLNSLFVVVPLALLALLFPASLSGIGLREVAFVGLLGSLGVPPEGAIALSWIAFAILILQAVAGGVLLALRSRKAHGETVVSRTPPMASGVEQVGQ